MTGIQTLKDPVKSLQASTFLSNFAEKSVCHAAAKTPSATLGRINDYYAKF